MGPRVGRRTLLAGAALLPLAACTAEPTPPPPPPDPDDLLRGAATEREGVLLAEYDRLIAVLPALTTRLLPLRAEHAEHLLALVGPPPTGSPVPSATRTPTPAPTPTPTPSSTSLPLPPEVPPPPATAEALAELLAVEQSAAGAHTADALAATDRDLAGLLASLAASESSHAVALA